MLGMKFQVVIIEISMEVFQKIKFRNFILYILSIFDFRFEVLKLVYYMDICRFMFIIIIFLIVKVGLKLIQVLLKE